MAFDLHQPLGVFDAGIGSYAVVQLLRQHFPQQDILYFADRASFPYGAKSKEELSAVVLSAIERLATLGAAAVVLASNAPSVVVLDDLAGRVPVPVLGIYPPVAQALRTSRTGHVAMLAVRSLVNSDEVRAYVAREAMAAGQAPHGQVQLVDASPLVEQVENGAFLAQPGLTQAAVTAFMQRLRADFPQVDTCTLSSTHLPWLAPFFQAAAPDMLFLDPAEEVVSRLQPHVSTGAGKTVCIASESAAHPLSGLKAMFSLLGVQMDPQRITTP